MKQEKIEALENIGFKRWQKGTMDRLYINAGQLGLICDYYKTGNIKHATFEGVGISNSEGRRLRFAKTYIDVQDGNIYSDSDRLKEATGRYLEKKGFAIAELND